MEEVDASDKLLFIVDSPLLDGEDSPGVWVQPEKETAKHADKGKSKILKILFFAIFLESPFYVS